MMSKVKNYEHQINMPFNWWRRLNPIDGASTGTYRSALAQMRRANSVNELLLVPEALSLAAQFRPRYERAAILAGVLAFVRETDNKLIARAIGRSNPNDESAPMSEIRFRRLLQSSDQDLLDSMRRLVRLMNGRVNVHDLSRTVLFWGDKIKQNWMFNYYGYGAALPSNSESAKTTEMSNQNIRN